MGSLVVILGLLIGCKGKVSDATFVEGEISGTGTVKFSSKKEGEAHVEYSLDEGKTWTSSPAVDAAKGKIPLLGLEVAADFVMKVVVESEGKSWETEEFVAETSPPPEGVVPFSVNSYDPSLACAEDALVMVSTISQSTTAMGIVNRDGKYVWAVANETPGTDIARVRPGRDGVSVLWNVADESRVADLGSSFRMNLDGSNRVETRTTFAHHEFVELPDEETIAWIAYDIREIDMPELGTSDPDPVVGEVVFQVAEGESDAGAASTVWSMWDETDWPFGFYVSGPEMEKCPTVPDARPGFLPGYCEFSHANSFAHVPEDDSFLVLFRWLDALVKIDRASGELVWVFGGLHDEFTGDDATRPIHGHFSDAWYDDSGLLHVLIVDNHDKKPDDVAQEDSKYTEFVLDEANRTFERVWFYQSDKFENLLGDIRRIPVDGCDNLLISFSAQGRLVEMTRDGEIAWDIGIPVVGAVTSRVTYITDIYDMTGMAYPE